MGLFLWINFVICVLCLSLNCRGCSFQPCGSLLGKGGPLGYLVCDFLLCFVTFPYGCFGQVLYVIV